MSTEYKAVGSLSGEELVYEYANLCDAGYTDEDDARKDAVMAELNVRFKCYDCCCRKERSAWEAFSEEQRIYNEQHSR